MFCRKRKTLKFALLLLLYKMNITVTSKKQIFFGVGLCIFLGVISEYYEGGFELTYDY